MPEDKLWHNKTETKNVKVAKVVEFIKTCDQYLQYLQLHDPPPFLLGKIRFSENAVGEEWVISFAWGL